MTDDITPAFVPIDLSPELQRASELKDLLWMREHDATPKYEIKAVMLELNIRLQQYVSQCKTYPFEALIFQTLQDFNKHVWIKQKGPDIDKSEPIALLRDGYKKIYVNPAVVRSDYTDGGVILFINDLSEVEERLSNKQSDNQEFDDEQNIIIPDDNDIPF